MKKEKQCNCEPSFKKLKALLGEPHAAYCDIAYKKYYREYIKNRKKKL